MTGQTDRNANSQQYKLEYQQIICLIAGAMKKVQQLLDLDKINLVLLKLGSG